MLVMIQLSDLSTFFVSVQRTPWLTALIRSVIALDDGASAIPA
jgi:hypothetical protein